MIHGEGNPTDPHDGDMPANLGEQLGAASAATRRALARAGIGDGTPGADSSPWAEQFVDQIFDRGSTLCSHARRRPVQPLFASAWERVWRCRPCDDAHARTAGEQMRTGNYRDLGLIEEHTCDRCRRYVGQLTMLIVRSGPMVLTAGICSSCASEAERAGAQELAS